MTSRKRPTEVPILSNIRTISSTCKFVNTDWAIWKLLFGQEARRVNQMLTFIKISKPDEIIPTLAQKQSLFEDPTDNILRREKGEQFEISAEVQYLYLRSKARTIIGRDLNESELIHLNYKKDNIEIWQKH